MPVGCMESEGVKGEGMEEDGWCGGVRVDGWIQGFIQRGGWNSPPPRNLEIEYGYYCGAINISYHVTGHKYVSSNVVWKVCPRLH